MCTVVIGSDDNDVNDDDDHHHDKDSVSLGFVKQIIQLRHSDYTAYNEVSNLKGGKIDRRQIQIKFTFLYISRQNI
jgi:hypothetical protein